jgi:uncharacterized repeat protein (TIGR03803 family)
MNATPRSLFHHVLCASLALGFAAAGPAARAQTFKVLEGFEDLQHPYARPIRDSSGRLYLTTSAGGHAGQGTVLRMAPDGTGVTVLHSFVGGVSDGWQPRAALALDSTGNLYGTTPLGGSDGAGTIFKIAPDGAYTILHSFGSSDGLSPRGELLLDTAGSIFGATYRGGTRHGGMVFRLDADGSLTELHSFALFDPAGTGPAAGLVRDASGNLYGTTEDGGPSNAGTVFRLSPGGAFTVLHVFSQSDGAFPQAELLLDGTGRLYGTTPYGGPDGRGTVFGMSTDGTGFAVLHAFAAVGPGRPSSSLVRDAAGKLCGTTSEGGESGGGIVFRLEADGSGFTILHSLSYFEGSHPFGGLTVDGAGAFYGTASDGGATGNGTVFQLSPQGVLSVLHSFGRDGLHPQGGLALDQSGRLHGTTAYGGARGSGGVFTWDPAGGFRLRHSFDQALREGVLPASTPVLDSSGNLYGTAQGGGTEGHGTVYKLAPDDELSILHSFAGPDGANAYAGVTFDAGGRLCGTTTDGGPFEQGVAYCVTREGSFSLLHSFSGSQFTRPYAGLTPDAAGNLYGATSGGGGWDLGTLFRIGGDGTFTVLHSFSGPDGQRPVAAPAIDAAGNLYGTAGGGVFNVGIAYRLDLDGSLAILHQFDGSDGSSAWSTPVFDSGGNLYGTTYGGGADHQGTVFKLGREGAFEILHSFDGSDGAHPYSGVVLDPAGNLYGTTYEGGPLGGGVVYKLSLDDRARMSTPTPGSPLTGDPVEFAWLAGTESAEYWLEVGTTPGGGQIYSMGLGTNLTATVTGLPSTGGPVHVRLWSRLPAPAGWVHNDYVYTARTRARATLTSPVPGSTLTSPTATFAWTAGVAAQEYWLEIGTSPGSGRLYSGSLGLSLGVTVSGLPTDAASLYVRLWTRFGDRGWEYEDYQYRAVLAAPATMTSPSPGSTLPGSTATFLWAAGSAASEYWLEVGTTPGGSEIHSASHGTGLSATVPGLPTMGGMVYARLWTRLPAKLGWVYNDYAFRAAALAGRADRR